MVAQRSEGVNAIHLRLRPVACRCTLWPHNSYGIIGVWCYDDTQEDRVFVCCVSMQCRALALRQVQWVDTNQVPAHVQRHYTQNNLIARFGNVAQLVSMMIGVAVVLVCWWARKWYARESPFGARVCADHLSLGRRHAPRDSCATALRLRYAPQSG